MKFVISNKNHDSQLRSLIRSIPMPGSIQIAFAREPNFFHSTSIEGKHSQVIVAIENESLVGMGVRSIKPMYINSNKMNFGYLSGLRAIERVRKGTGLARGYRFLHKLHEDKLTPAYISTIIDENEIAKSILTSERAGLPHYIDMGRIYTYAINLNRNRSIKKYDKSLCIELGDTAHLSDILDFMHTHGKKKQFFPVYEENDFQTEFLRDFNIKNFYIAKQYNEICGIAGVWDQRKFKQNIIHKYSSSMRLFRPLFNCGLNLIGYKPLPGAGQHLNSFYISFVCIAEDNPDILSILLEHIYHDYKNKNFHYFLIGLHEKNPLRSAISKFLSIKYISRLYVVCWGDGLDFCNNLDRNLIPHLEIATL